MASAFGHALTAIALGNGFPKKMTSIKFWVPGIFCSVIPDADVLAFKFSIPYEHLFGHRGFFHSILFAVLLGIIISLVFYFRDIKSKRIYGYILIFSICTISHSVLDAMTSGGLGVAFFAPWDNTRYFFPWQPIKVAPIGISSFFSDWGLKVLLSELIWIGIPAVFYLFVVSLLRRIKFLMIIKFKH